MSSPGHYLLAITKYILKTIGAPLGSLGPVDLSIPMIVDHHALALESFICGANEKDYHLKNVSWVRDIGKIEAFEVTNKWRNGLGQLCL